MDVNFSTDPDGREIAEFRFEVERGCDGFRLDRYLVHKFKRMSRSLVQKVIRATVTLNGEKPSKPGAIVRASDIVVIRRPLPAEPEVPGRFEILADHPSFLAMDKPAGLPVHPTARFFKGTATSLLRERFGDDPKPVPVHRLDRETSGVLLVARNKEAEKKLKKAFFEGHVEKTYLAVAHGRLERPLVIDRPLGSDERSNIRIKMGVSPGGAEAVTEIEPLAVRDRFTLLKAKPKTGRQHQIRAHLESIGHPIVGDKIYGVPDSVFLAFIETGTTDEMLETLLLPRHALHAFSLTFPHPETGQPVTVEAPLPADMRTFLENLTPPAWPLNDR